MASKKKSPFPRYLLTTVSVGGVFLIALSLVLFYQPHNPECVKISVFGQSIERCGQAFAQQGQTTISQNNPAAPTTTTNTSSAITNDTTTPTSGNIFGIEGFWKVNGTSSNYPVSAVARFNSSSSNMTGTQQFGYYKISGNISGSTFNQTGSFHIDYANGVLTLEPSGAKVSSTSYRMNITSENGFLALNASTNERYTFTR